MSATVALYRHIPTNLPRCDPATDRLLYYKQEHIARIYLNEHGVLQDQWHWAVQWIRKPNTGECDSLAEALALVKAMHIAEVLENSVPS